MSEQPQLQSGQQSEQPQGGTGAWAGLLFLLPVLCCGGPFIIAVLAAASALARGLVIGALVAVIGSIAVIVLRRRSRSKGTCCEPIATKPPVRETRW